MPGTASMRSFSADNHSHLIRVNLHKKIHSYAVRNGLVSTAWILDTFGVVRDTARRDLEHLVNLGLLIRKGKGRGTHYVLPCEEKETTDK